MNSTTQETIWQWLAALCMVAFAAACFVTALTPISSYDAWWHVKTGEVIAQQGSIPDKDPFTFTAPGDDPQNPGRVPFLLGQYWLAQRAMAWAEHAGGLAGLIYLRAAAFAALGVAALLVALVAGAQRAWLITMPIYAVAMRVGLDDADRPQVMSFLFAALALLVAEGAARTGKRWLPYLIVPLSVLFANMHGGAVVGVGVAIVYALASLVEQRLRPIRLHFCLAAGLAVLAYGLNPTGWHAWAEAVGTLQGGQFAGVSQEYASPLSILPYVKGYPSWMAYWAMAALGALAVVHFAINKRLSHALLLGGMLAASLMSMRHAMFFLPIGAALVALALEQTLLKRINTKPTLALGVVALVILCTLALSPAHPNRLGITQPLRPYMFPTGAAEFIARSGIEGRAFNLIGWGGYLEYRLWPRMTFFADTRQLVQGVTDEYSKIIHNVQGAGLSALEGYGIKAVIIPAVDARRGAVYPLALALAQSPAWELYYADGQAMVFAHKGQINASGLEQQGFEFEVMSEAQYWQPRMPWVEGLRRLSGGR